MFVCDGTDIEMLPMLSVEHVISRHSPAVGLNSEQVCRDSVDLFPTDKTAPVNGQFGVWLLLVQGIKYSIEVSSSINTGVEMTRSHLAD